MHLHFIGPLRVDVSQCTKKKKIFHVIVNHLGLDKGEHEVGETDRKGDDPSVDSRLELARLEVEMDKLKAENLRLEHELTLRQIELKQVLFIYFTSLKRVARSAYAGFHQGPLKHSNKLQSE